MKQAYFQMFKGPKLKDDFYMMMDRTSRPGLD